MSSIALILKDPNGTTYRTAIGLQTGSEETTHEALDSGGIAIPKKCVPTYDSLGRMTRHRVNSPDGNLTTTPSNTGLIPRPAARKTTSTATPTSVSLGKLS